MKKFAFGIALTVCFLTCSTHSAVVVTGADNPASREPVIGLNSTVPPQQDVVVAGPLPSGTAFGFNSVGFNALNGVPVGFITLVDSNYIAIFTNQFETNIVALPFAGTNFSAFAGRLPVGFPAPQFPVTAATNGVAGPVPAVPAQPPIVNVPPATVSPVVPQPGGVPPAIPPDFTPTGRPLAPPQPLAPIIPPSGTPTPSPTPIPPASTPIPPQSTPIPPQSTPVPPPTIPR